MTSEPHPATHVTAGTGSMPSLARLAGADGVGWFIVTDPNHQQPRRRPIRVSSAAVRRAVVGVIALACVLGSALWAASRADSLLSGLLLLLLGGSAGALLGGMATVLLGGLPARRRPARPGEGAGVVPAGPRHVVRPSDGRAWRLCEIAALLAESTAWADRTVDPERRVPSIIWSAVGRSLLVDRQYQDAQRAADHPSLEDLARDTLARIAAERASLDLIEANLRAVLTTAVGIDERRAQARQDRRSAQQRALEERELRARLAGRGAVAGSPVESHLQADTSAGLAAEAEVVAELLARSDAMLRDLD